MYTQTNLKIYLILIEASIEQIKREALGKPFLPPDEDLLNLSPAFPPVAESPSALTA
jgi:hypothetical protein